MPSSWNLGFVEKGKKVQKEVKVLNSGYKDVVLLAVKTTSNISANFDIPMTIHPGKVEKFLLELKASDDMIKINEKVVFFTDIPNLPTLDYFIRGLVISSKEEKVQTKSSENK